MAELTSEPVSADAAQWQVDADPSADNTVWVRLAGSWRLQDRLPAAAQVYGQVEARGGVQRVVFDAEQLSGWDSGFLTFLVKLQQLIARAGLETDPSRLPQGVQRLLRLASAVPERAGARRGAVTASMPTAASRRSASSAR
jgi:phospholipid/cholesterol/gamma-HCH transport system permease protein